jgi:hypothetical protein
VASNRLSDLLIRAAAERLTQRKVGDIDYSALSSWFKERMDFDRSGLRQCLLDVQRSLDCCPPSPNTLRGRIGNFLVQVTRKPLWWVVWAIGIRDKALMAICESVFELHEIQLAKEKDMRAEIDRLGSRIAALEEQLTLSHESKSETLHSTPIPPVGI